MMHFKTKRLEVRPISDADRAAVIDLLTNDLVKQTYMVPDFQSREEAAKLFERLKALSLREDRYVAGIYLDRAFIGILNETEVIGNRIELGYAILPQYHNRGYGTEALTGAIPYLFERGFDEVMAGAFEENEASIRVMIKSGMSKLDHQDEIEYRGKVHRCVYYSIRKQESVMKVYDRIVSRVSIDKGWSGDKKYCVTTTDGERYLLRISTMERLDRKKREFEKMKEVAASGIPMCLPIAFGTCDEGVYSIQSWIVGEDAEEMLMTMDLAAQYRYGLDAGQILAKIHTIPAPADAPSWETRFNAKIDRKIAMYENCELKYESGGDAFLEYLAQNRHLLSGRPQSYQHGDYHIGNMMIDYKGVLTIIDFDRDDFGDPWEEFNRIVWCAQATPAFASGMVDGYFDGEVPMEFWKLLALYICSNTLSSLPWAIPFGEGEIQVMRKQAAQVLEWYDGMNNVIPTWYQKN